MEIMRVNWQRWQHYNEPTCVVVYQSESLNQDISNNQDILSIIKIY